MARGERPCGTADVTTSGSALRAQYRATRARLMGRSTAAPPPAALADAAPQTAAAPVSGPACWLPELTAFNEELRRLFLRRMPGAASAPGERIRALVASHYGITIAEICGASSLRRCAWPRQVAMYLCARQAGLSTPGIARLFGDRDPSTVLFALHAVAGRAARDPAIAQDISALMAKCDRGPSA